MSNLKLQKLTENYEKSVGFGKKVQEQLAAVGQGILQTRLSMAKISEALQQAASDCAKLELKLKKEQEETSGYEYKLEKVLIRLRQYQRKVQIQQNMLEKKMAHQRLLQKKCEELQGQLKSKTTIDSQIEHTKEGILIIQKKINDQVQTIDKLCNQQFVLNKTVRTKEDEVHRKKKSNQNKQTILSELKSKLENESDKQNNPLNKTQTKEGGKVRDLLERKESMNKALQQKIDWALQIYKQLELFSENTLSVRKNLQKTDEFVNESKVKRSGLTKLAQMIKYDQQVKEN